MSQKVQVVFSRNKRVLQWVLPLSETPIWGL